jgi:hypothetical protein
MTRQEEAARSLARTGKDLKVEMAFMALLLRRLNGQRDGLSSDLAAVDGSGQSLQVVLPLSQGPEETKGWTAAL